MTSSSGRRSFELQQPEQQHWSTSPHSHPSKLLTFLSAWWNECAWPGLGLFGESYLLFSIGLLRPLWSILYPDCFDVSYQEGGTCRDLLLKSISFSVVLGVIVGMILLGTLSNTLGRRTGSCLTATLMSGGAWGITLVSLVLASQPERLFQCMSVLLFVFGVGVGGEYPLSASSASERAMQTMKLRMQQERQQQGQQYGYQPPTTLQTYTIKESDENRSEELIPTPTSTTATPSQSLQKRGLRVQLVFSMQGMGIFCNSILLMFLLWIMQQPDMNNENKNNNDDDENYDMTHYDSATLLSVWRITYAIGALILTYVLVSRIQYLTESEVWKQDKEQRNQLSRPTKHRHQSPPKKNSSPVMAPPILQVASSVSSLSTPSLVLQKEDYPSVTSEPSADDEFDRRIVDSPVRLLFRNYGVRLLGTSLSWLLWDVAFYGNKLFQSSFLLALTGSNTTLLELASAASLNAFVALLGYLCAAALLDHARVGRLGLQQYGFLVTGSLFVLCGFLYEQLSSRQGRWALVCLYLGSSFFGQCGPNATTFLLPAEVFPTEMRTMCHGISAASGKVGALLASVLFQSSTSRPQDLFLWSGYASFAACLVTFWTLPETCTLDLYEVDRKWHLTLQGKKSEYEGDANDPKYLSFYERQQLNGRLFPKQSILEDWSAMQM